MQNRAGESPQDFSPNQITTDNRVKLGTREAVLLRKQNTNCLSSAKQSALETNRQVILYVLNKFYLGIYMFMQILHAKTTVEKRGREFQREWGGCMESFRGRNGKGDM